MKRILQIFILFLSISACRYNPEPERINSVFDRLLGTWIIQDSSSTISESWVKINDSLYSAVSYYIKDEDTLSKEVISIKKTNGTFIYTARVSNQNNAKPVDFMLSDSAYDYFAFQNPKHDFPQKISYHFVSDDSIFAEISGIVENYTKKVPFPFHRKKRARL